MSKPSIYIDFLGGSHGNFLNFFCNKHLAKLSSNVDHPFNTAGSSHNYKFDNPVFFAAHYSQSNIEIPVPAQVISIQMTVDDLLALQCISLLRAGDHNINPESLSINTYNKLNQHRAYKFVLDNIYKSFFENQIEQSYLQVMDPSWPTVRTLEEYRRLPDHIKHECDTVHNLRLLMFDEDHPDCPDDILHDFFKFGFLDPTGHGFMIKQQSMIYNANHDVYVFPFGCFYNWNKFSIEIEKLGNWCGMPVDINDKEMYNLHQGFVNRQPYKDIKSKCDKLIQKILNKESVVLTDLNVIERAYISAGIEQAHE